MAAVSRVPGAIRAYRGSCCGHYHITRTTADEYAQRVAAHVQSVPDAPTPATLAAILERKKGRGEGAA